MKVSIILPTYNVEKHIERALDSCINQSYKDIEIIVVDDCGIDKSIKIAEIKEKQDCRIKIIKNAKNEGAFSSRKNGVLKSCGDLIVFLDPDDTLNKTAIEKIATKAYQSDAEIIFYGVNEIGFRQKKLFSRSTTWFPSEADATTSPLIDFFSQKKIGLKWGTPGKAYVKSVLNSTYDELEKLINKKLVYGEDSLLLLFASLHAKKYSIIKEKLYNYINHKESITNTIDPGTNITKYSNLEYIIDITKNKLSTIVEKNKRDALNNYINIHEADYYWKKSLESKNKINKIKYGYLSYKRDYNIRVLIKSIFNN